MLKVDKWITFKPWKLRAVMNDSATETRRALRHQHIKLDGGGHPYIDMGNPDEWDGAGVRRDVPCPYGVPGDILGIKEGYRIIHDIPRGRFVTGEYLIDNAHFEAELTQSEYDKWTARKYPYRATPGRFMYRSLCRTRLLNKRVSVERVRDISDLSCFAEGVKWLSCNAGGRSHGFYGLNMDDSDWRDYVCCRDARQAFSVLWDKINAARGYPFSDNNWVWVVEFERLAE